MGGRLRSEEKGALLSGRGFPSKRRDTHGYVGGVMERYAKYVRDNPELAKSLPSLVPVLVCLLPARQSGGGGPEVIAEAGYALSNLWSLLHEHLLHERGPDGETGLAAFRSAPVQTK